MEDVRAHAWWAAKVSFPAVEGCRFTHTGKSVLCIPRDQMPTIGFNPRTRVAFAFDDSGEGVATGNRSGCTLADLLTGAESGRTRPPMADKRRSTGSRNVHATRA